MFAVKWILWLFVWVPLIYFRATLNSRNNSKFIKIVNNNKNNFSYAMQVEDSTAQTVQNQQENTTTDMLINQLKEEVNVNKAAANYHKTEAEALRTELAIVRKQLQAAQEIIKVLTESSVATFNTSSNGGGSSVSNSSGQNQHTTSSSNNTNASRGPQQHQVFKFGFNITKLYAEGKAIVHDPYNSSIPPQEVQIQIQQASSGLKSRK